MYGLWVVCLCQFTRTVVICIKTIIWIIHCLNCTVPYLNPNKLISYGTKTIAGTVNSIKVYSYHKVYYWFHSFIFLNWLYYYFNVIILNKRCLDYRACRKCKCNISISTISISILRQCNVYKNSNSKIITCVNRIYIFHYSSTSSKTLSKGKIYTFLK